MEYVNDYIEKHKTRFLEELFELIRIPSISSIEEYKPDIYKAAKYWKELLLISGVDKAELIEREGNPLVYAEKIKNPSFPTVLVYSYLDVLPVEQVDLWNLDPFEPEIQSMNICGRGAVNKAQGIIHAKAFELLNKTDNLLCNVKFIAESENNIGSHNLIQWCIENKEMLRADVILVSDTPMISADMPSITTGFRGLASWQIELTGPSRDLHSGSFGGIFPNSINVLCSILDKIMDKEGKIQVPRFYDDVLEVSSEERMLLREVPMDKINKIEINNIPGEKSYSPIERISIRPNFNINGIWGGYTGQGAKDVIPSEASAKISCRLVPNQDFRKITSELERYLFELIPKSINLKINLLRGENGYYCPINIPPYWAAEKAIINVYGKRPIPYRHGGNFPLISFFEEIFGIKSILLGFDLKKDTVHSPTELFSLDQFYNGIKTISLFYKYFTEIGKMQS